MLHAVNFPSASQFLSPLSGCTGWLAGFVPFFPHAEGPSRLELGISQQFRWAPIKFFPALLKRTECSDMFQGVSFLSSPAGSTRRFVFDVHCEDFVELLEVKGKKKCGSAPVTGSFWEF